MDISQLHDIISYFGTDFESKGLQGRTDASATQSGNALGPTAFGPRREFDVAKQQDARRLYLRRAQELRELAASLKHAELQSAVIAIALQYERLAELPKGEKPN